MGIQMQVTVLGTGLMGFEMATRLAADGLDVRAWNRTTEKARPLEQHGVRVSDDAADAVAGSSVVITMLYDVEAVLDVMRTAQPQLGGDTVWLQMSTVGPDGTAQLADFAAGHDIAMLDAPVLGTKKPAADGTLVVLASGSSSLRAQVEPVLASVGAKTVWLGEELGLGSKLKLVCNAWVLTITAATAQSVALAGALELDPQSFLDAIEGSASDCQYAHLKGGQMMAGNYTPSFPISGGLKDQALIRSAATATGVDSTLIDAVGDLNQRAADRGHGSDDLAAVYAGFGTDRSDTEAVAPAPAD